jgi:hypothetical protein
MTTRHSRFSGVRLPAVALVPAVIAAAFAAGPAVAGAATSPSADLAVGWTAARDAFVVNNGQSTAYNVQVTERLTASTNGGFVLLRHLSTSACVEGAFLRLNCTWPSLAPGHVVVIYARFEAGSLEGKGEQAVTWTAFVSSSTPDPNLANDSASLRLVWWGTSFPYFG